MDLAVIIFVIAALLVGLGFGWFLGGRPLAAMRAERDRHLDQFRAAITDLAAERKTAERVEAMEVELREERRRAEGLANAVAAHERGEAERVRAHEAQIAQLRDMEAKLNVQFSELATKALNDAQTHFLKRADERFVQAGEKSEQQLKILLQPVETTLKRYEEGLAKVEKDRVDSYAGLREAVEQVRLGQGQVKEEAARLVNALRSSPKARGRWGEQQLRNVLEMAGLSAHADFRSEVSVDTDDGRLRPDVIVRLPGGRQLVIDAKCSLNAYLDASEQVDEAERIRFLRAHAAAIRGHANQLGQKAYWSQFGNAADYVVMFIPGEHFLSAALEQDNELWEWAFERKVLLATPTNLIAIARTVSAVWRQEKLAEEAATISALGKELHARLATMGEHVVRLGRNLEMATGAYNAFVGSLETKVMSQAKKFETLEVSGGVKTIEELPLIDTVARPLTKLAGPLDEAAE